MDGGPRIANSIENFLEIRELPMEISTNMDGWINLKKHWLFDDNILGFVADAHDL